jgi:hypothetical protein
MGRILDLINQYPVAFAAGYYLAVALVFAVAVEALN